MFMSSGDVLIFIEESYKKKSQIITSDLIT